MRQLVDRGVVMEVTLVDHRLMRPNPVTLNWEHLEQLADMVLGDVSMLLRFSPASASVLTPDRYLVYEERYAKGRKSWRPWNEEFTRSSTSI